MAKRCTSSPHFALILLAELVLLQHLAVADIVPAIFIFGDSTLDVGTNNFVPGCEATANVLFNGIDYPYSVPTGRFSNGLNAADQIVRLMGYERSPQSVLFLLLNQSSSFKSNILQGANFASGGSGIQDTTGSKLFQNVIPLSEQIRQFSTVRGNITEILGPARTDTLLSQSLFLISSGSNDVFDYQRSNDTTIKPPELMATLQSTYQIHLKNLYCLGARKFAIVSIPPIGCCPAERARNENGGCIDEANQFAQAFFTATADLLHNMSSELEGMKYSLGNSYEMTMTIIQDPYVFGLKNVTAACCGVGYLNGEGQCNHTSNLCSNREEYLFWDWFHPTEKASKLAATSLFSGSPRFVTPMNISQLVQINL